MSSRAKLSPARPRDEGARGIGALRRRDQIGGPLGFTEHGVGGKLGEDRGFGPAPLEVDQPLVALGCQLQGDAERVVFLPARVATRRVIGHDHRVRHAALGVRQRRTVLIVPRQRGCLGGRRRAAQALLERTGDRAVEAHLAARVELFYECVAEQCVGERVVVELIGRAHDAGLQRLVNGVERVVFVELDHVGDDR